jgi:Zn-dependent protease with chaperone function
VLAHELGHFKHKHVLKRIVSTFALSLVGLALLGWLSNQQAFYAGLGVHPNLGARTTRWRCCCSCWRCRASASSSRR